MTTCLGKSCSFGLPRGPFVNCCQFMYLVISLLFLRAGCGIWFYQFLIIAYLFTLNKTHEGRPKMSCLRKHCFTFSGPTHTLTHLFLFLIAKHFFNHRLFLILFLNVFLHLKVFFKTCFHFIQHKLFRHFKKRDIACVLVLCLLHVIGAMNCFGYLSLIEGVSV